jgi:hypothetical protein
MIRRILVSLFSFFGIEVRRKSSPSLTELILKSLPYPDHQEISGLTVSEKHTLNNFRVPRYHYLNECRWRILLQSGLSFHGKTIFEPGAGIGDQTQWLLSQGVKEIIVSDGRPENVGIIRKRFLDESRVTVVQRDLEAFLTQSSNVFQTDIVFLWGVYYHIHDPYPEFKILRQLSKISPIIVFDYLESLTELSWVQEYNYDDPSASISKKSLRLSRSDLVQGLLQIYNHVYFPKTQLDIIDPSNIATPRRIVIASQSPLNYFGLEETK